MAISFCVTRSSRNLVRPIEKTPTGTLDLSIIDRLPVLRCNARTLHVFRHGPEAAQVIKEALSKALVAYFPLAGRLKESENGLLQIDCCEQGAWFVEASADCTLEDVNYFDSVTAIPYDNLLPDHGPEIEGSEPLVQMQVTQFGCGGFVIGLIFCHSICDGLGAAQFLNAVGEFAKGVDHLSISPVWCRDFSSSPLQKPDITTLPILPTPPTPNYRLEHANVDISLDQINKLKKEFHDSTGQTSSAFEVIAATFWKHRTLSIYSNHNTEVKLVFFANCRQLLDPPLAEGFYGNCFFPVTITASSGSLAKKSNADVIKLIKQAKAGLSVEFNKYLNGEHSISGDDPFAPPLNYTTLFVSEWGRLGFNTVDYAWGPPVHVIPIQGSSIMPVGILGSLPLPKKGVRLMTWCIEEAHRKPFLDNMMNITSNI
ncbi:hypothetical protein K2173_008080 [Erythroxylum novogranatense]|uniref:Uncharacterized protein n=1 Tax=Erythroxylum novogranatense TaxID=1862640 RepID=A0AAV8S9B5_9ROSI|nr:hypothetical protein K2173_008080 [Erythroxylum novogranatense]